MPIPKKLFDCFNQRGDIIVPFLQLRDAAQEALAIEWDASATPDWLKQLDLWLCEYDRGDRTEKEVLALWAEAKAKGNEQRRRKGGLDVSD